MNKEEKELQAKQEQNESLADSKKIDLYINNNGEGEQGISIMNVFSTLGKRFHIYVFVMIIGLLISALSFYILMLSIYLLVEKNASKLENLLLIGYSPVKVALPYQALTILLNVAVLVVAVIVVALVRSYYMDVVTMLYPQIETGTLFPAIGLGILLFVVVSLLNIVVVKGKVMQIWQRKD